MLYIELTSVAGSYGLLGCPLYELPRSCTDAFESDLGDGRRGLELRDSIRRDVSDDRVDETDVLIDVATEAT